MFYYRPEKDFKLRVSTEQGQKFFAIVDPYEKIGEMNRKIFEIFKLNFGSFEKHDKVNTFLGGFLLPKDSEVSQFLKDNDEVEMRFLKEKQPASKENPPKNLKTSAVSREKPELLPRKKQKTDTINKAKNEHLFENPKFLESIDKALEKSQLIIENEAKSEKKNEKKIKKPTPTNPKIVEIVDNVEQPENKNNSEIIHKNGDVQVIENNFSIKTNKIKKKVLIPTPLEKISEKKEIFMVSRNSEIKKIIIPPQEDLIISPQQDLLTKNKENEILESSVTKDNPEKNKMEGNLKTIENSQKKTEIKNQKKEKINKKNSDSKTTKENQDFTPNKLLERLKATKNYKNELIQEENSKKEENSKNQEEISKKQEEIKKVDKTPQKPQNQKKQEPVKNQDITIQELNIPRAFQEITAKKEKNPAKTTPKNLLETIPVDSVNTLDIKEAKQQKQIQRMMKKMERHLAGELSDVSPEKTSEDEKEERNL